MNKFSVTTLPLCAAVIAAGGKGLRMGGKLRKQFIEIGGKSLLRHSLDLFLGLEEIVRIVVVLPEDTLEEFRGSLAPSEKEIILAVAGGETRQQSVYNGLTPLDPATVRVVAIHDAARPLVSPTVVRETLRVAASGMGALAACRVRDTVKRADNKLISGTVERSGLWLAQTPQSFPLDMILQAHRAAQEESFEGTDDAALCERAGFPVQVVESDPGNLKVTEKSDLDYLEYRLGGKAMTTTEPAGGLRVGEGFDVHALAEGRKLLIGGVEIAYSKGLAGHSDADVLYHAVTDALLGAAALGDIGGVFPDDDPSYKDADSAVLLARVAGMLRDKGFRPLNLDATVIAQKPKLAPYIGRMRENLARLLGLEIERVSVKAKTHEGLGALGRGEGISARAVVLVTR
ncbi:MAG: hypothetical protein A3F83_01755 [Candidatus Glassbacteria bacterium RIFCSPLOWO2_12_FULL_58_11]|uniref:Bifunctional enzyme IspD/IspF n=1 Tax=Candidatus Glassbacteria bacterium RIFCSPLOWO2_12_FULL_58_11 TaxID=1817867 RepID=A0A1F5Z389_9BACT|nr:MAG: hypothetical protein A3F83_01755 [Candidatus Glassbacteria bacterium RIFCSPLOWO2_12_FULL_58_11]